MKRLLLIVFLATAGIGFSQSFSGKGFKAHSISLNTSYFHHVNDKAPLGFVKYNGNNGFGILGQGDYGIHPYLSLGWQAGVSWGRINNNAWSRSNTFYVSGGATFNFHFYQLISDKTGANIFADQLDIYAGINLGFGVGFRAYEDLTGYKDTKGFPVYYGGGHLGIKWYPKAGNIGIMFEGGYGKSYASFGVVFK